MEYEEYKRISGRKDISVTDYDEGVEPFYMAIENIDKEEFCKITKNMPPLMFRHIATAFQSRSKLEEAHYRELATARQELAETKSELVAARQEVVSLKLKIAYQPENTIRDVRALLSTVAEKAKAEAIRLGIITK